MIESPTAQDALLIIDVQNDFCAGGALEVPDGDAVVPIINALMPRFSTVVATQDWHPASHQSFASQHEGRAPFGMITMPYGEQTLWPDHCVQGTAGAELHPDLDRNPVQLIVRKGFRAEIDSYSAFYENDRRTATGLAGYLRERGVDSLLIVGLATDYCVRYSAEDAAREGFTVQVLEPACRGIDLEGSVAAAWESMTALGVKRVNLV